jgi:hypothetical protein
VQIGFIVGTPTILTETEEYFKGAAEGLQEYFKERKVSSRLLDINLKELKSLY